MKKAVLLLITAAACQAAAQPAVIDYRCSQAPVKNQGGRNTCSGFAVAACLETFAGVPADVSEQHIYAGLKMLEYKNDDSREKVDMGGRINLYPQTLQQYGVLPETDMPYSRRQLNFSDSDYNLVQVIRESQTGPVSMLLHAEKAKFFVRQEDCEVAEFTAGLDAQNIKRLLQQGVRAIGIGYYVNQYWSGWERRPNLVITPDSVGIFMDSSRNLVTLARLKQLHGDTVFNAIDNYFNPDGSRPWRFVTDAEPQGHAVTIVGYNQQGFIIKNSWGSTWGDGGYATVSYDYHRLFAKRMLAVKKVTFARRKFVPLSPAVDMRLKVVPQEPGGALSFSVYSTAEKVNPLISLVEYSLYEVKAGQKTLLDRRTVAAGIGAKEYSSSFEAVLLRGSAALQPAPGPGSTLQAEVTFTGAKTIKRVYRNIRRVTADYRAAL